MRLNRFCIVFIMAAVLAGCTSGGHRAPVIEHGEIVKKSEPDRKTEPVKKTATAADAPYKTHIVQKGDTLYGIAFNYGFDHNELAEANNIQDPGMIQIGQQIRLFSNKAAPVAQPVEIKPLEKYSSVESRPLESKAVINKPDEPLIKEQPKLVKYAYSEEALAQIEKVQEAVKSDAVAKVESKPVPEAKQPEVKQPEAKPGTVTGTANEDGEEALEWTMPAEGKLIAQFSESANSKGIDIAGKLGQPVIASAPGKVVYSGSGLRGYGKIIIIKHNKTFISAYAHNDQVLVKEGQTVTRGQKIAEMGNTDADQVKLHFEVRRFGKPVDPAKYLRW